MTENTTLNKIDTFFQPFDKRLAELRSRDLSKTIIAVDFDGTCVFHEFPRIGKDVPRATIVLRTLLEAGAMLILWTMRSDQPKVENDPHGVGAAAYREHAVNWATDRGIVFFGVNRNPQQSEWTSSPKAYAHFYIDDAAIGCPLTVNPLLSNRPFVDWDGVLTQLLLRIE